MASQDKDKDNDHLAADLIRRRLESIYADEPNAKEEATEAKNEPAKARSKHQQFMYDLSTSGQSLADIQTSWHNYYQNLSDEEKHDVWQEFYAEHGRNADIPEAPSEKSVKSKKTEPADDKPQTQTVERPKKQLPSVAQLKQQIAHKASAGGKIRPKHHLKSLVFGLVMGSIVIFIFLFSFFNERIIAPFITPSRHVSSTPIIIDPNTTSVDPEPKIIIPKINVEIPVDYNEKSIDEAAVDRSLENGILHYPTTSNPGELGNAAFFGHSSNNIFNKGKYKFAFVLLKQLESGDTFYITKDGKRYTYQVYDKKIVKPDEVSVLNPTDKPAVATLITCDPPGTSINRLVVYGVQINPDPSSNAASTAQTNTAQPKTLPSNAPSLWSRLFNWLSN